MYTHVCAGLFFVSPTETDSFCPVLVIIDNPVLGVKPFRSRDCIKKFLLAFNKKSRGRTNSCCCFISYFLLYCLKANNSISTAVGLFSRKGGKINRNHCRKKEDNGILSHSKSLIILTEKKGIYSKMNFLKK